MSYNIIADYSEVFGGKILPFQVELDEPNCILNPGFGSNQKFSYTIKAKGGYSNEESLTRFILGINEDIKPDHIKNISVVINGKKQNVRFDISNPNVMIENTEDCSGLSFKFDLNKNNGIMNVSFELATPYEIGPIPVCIFGDDVKKIGLTIGGPFALPGTPDSKKPGSDDSCPDEKKCFESVACEKFDYKEFDFSVPVSIKPFVIIHEPEIKCVGDLKIYPGTIKCENEHDSFDFNMVQQISIKVPVQFGAKTCFDKLCVEEHKDEKERDESDE